MLIPVPEFQRPPGIMARVFRVAPGFAKLDWAISAVAFYGGIPDGSGGRDHAEFVKLTCLDAMARQDAKCLIMDLRECDYAWGNSLEAAFDAVRRLYHYEWHDLNMTPPVKVVISQRSAGLKTLLPPELLFDDVESAIASCSEDLEKWDED